MRDTRSIENSSVLAAYARWAPVYDLVFGAIADSGRRQAVEHINNRRGRVLEVGVGTGISLPHYRRDLRVVGIDLSAEMLARARRRVARHGLAHVEAVHEMDAGALDFAEGTFDIVVAMYVLTTVPDPARVMAELERVCAPGGEVIIVNHFSAEKGARAWAEKRLAPLAALLGWRPDFPLETVTGQDRLRLVERRPLKPFGFFTMLRFVRRTEPARDEPARDEEMRREPAALSGRRGAVAAG